MNLMQVEVLVNSLECRMIEELQANAASQLYQLQTEMIRDDGALPTDVWKKLVRDWKGCSVFSCLL